MNSIYINKFLHSSQFLHNCLSDFSTFATYLMCSVNIFLLLELDRSEFIYLVNFANSLEGQT